MRALSLALLAVPDGSRRRDRRAAVSVLALAVAAGLLAGCTTTPGGTTSLPGILAPAKPTGLFAYDGAGNALALPEGAAATWLLSDLKHKGAEPTMGVDGKGYLYVVSSNDVFRSKDHGKTWELASPQANFPRTLDPMLWVDQDTGRVFLDHLYVACSYLAYSDDQGGNWLYNPFACGRPADDHQTLATGKPIGVTTTGYPNVVYYGYNDVAVSVVPGVAEGGVTQGGTSSVARSTDGGITFPLAVIAIDAAHCGGLNGHLKADKDGILYLPAAGCPDNTPVVAISRDSGFTWEQHLVGTKDIGRSAPGDDPSIALDTAGNAYLVYPGKDALMYGAISTDKGKTWGAPFKVSPPEITSTIMAVSTAGDPNHVAFGYYGTTASTKAWASPNSDDAAKEAVWHLYVTYSTNALEGAGATWITQQVTPDDNPVSIGRVHNGGSDGTPDRNLLDFFDMVHDKEGRVYITYTDGCYHKCGSDPKTRDSETSVAVLQEGVSLVGTARLMVP